MIIYINGKKYLMKHILQMIVDSHVNGKKFDELLAEFDAAQDRRNKIQKAVQARQGEFYGKPADRMAEIRERIEKEEGEKIDREA